MIVWNEKVEKLFTLVKGWETYLRHIYEYFNARDYFDEELEMEKDTVT